MPSLSSHVLDTTLGKPAVGMPLTLKTPDGQCVEGITNADGRCNEWQGIRLTTGTYTLQFNTGDYLRSHHGSAFYPHADITFCIETDEHYHIPLLISPFGYSTYRGS
ncbi:hydroxyisourate hydrolase [Aestuariibacter halophilus]|uniref:5-hydroxyisourate hydrolase n=1 Tax=Fluctibacter halophilus TaxID=226011 RepID=A0ABS8G5Q8_9ALTE|nr:hydroxyisourate hydrolase [Aestuariibacter halophilus]MCC2615738.1 hydroxyisourate hydrolase [Aestuariibacter halophilus]